VRSKWEALKDYGNRRGDHLGRDGVDDRRGAAGARASNAKRRTTAVRCGFARADGTRSGTKSELKPLASATSTAGTAMNKARRMTTEYIRNESLYLFHCGPRLIPTLHIYS
jgi:hypothetical protein